VMRVIERQVILLELLFLYSYIQKLESQIGVALPKFTPT